jgi:hypothetical protein
MVLPVDTLTTALDSLSATDSLYINQYVVDSLVSSGRSRSSLWLETVTAPGFRLPFLASLLLIFGGIIAVYLLRDRAKRADRNDQLQSRALRMASLAILFLATKGVFFLLATLTIVNYLPPSRFGQIYWLGWQVSMVWFIFFGFRFALAFTRSKKIYDRFFNVFLFMVFLLLSLFYNEVTWKNLLSLVSSVPFDFDKFPVFYYGYEGLWAMRFPTTKYTMTLHFVGWVVLFGYSAYLIYRRAKTYQNDSSRTATLYLAAAFGSVALLGAINLMLLVNKGRYMAGTSFLAATLSMGAIYFSVRNVYQRGRYKRL